MVDRGEHEGLNLSGNFGSFVTRRGLPHDTFPDVHGAKEDRASTGCV